MPNGGELLDAVKALNADGELTPEVTSTLVLAAVGDVLTVVREIKNDNVEIKNNITVLVEKQGKNKDEIDLLRKRSWAVDTMTGILASIGIIIGASK